VRHLALSAVDRGGGVEIRLLTFTRAAIVAEADLIGHVSVNGRSGRR